MAGVSHLGQRPQKHITNGVTRRALRALAAQAVEGAAWERRGNASTDLRSASALREPDLG
jgi:hypothetical protein